MMDKTKTKWWIRPLVEYVRNKGINACEQKALSLYRTFIPAEPTFNIGGGENLRWPNAECIDAMHSKDLDFNTSVLPIDSKSVQTIVCEQTIEHLHNTTWFLSELRRIIKPNGNLLISTENLASIPNMFALMLQKAPFSTQALRGQFLGGWKDGPAGYEDGVHFSHPTFSGVHGHVRVMTVNQIYSVLENAGFKVCSKHGFGFNHYVLFHAKPI